jgi:hypothetical protein
VKTPKEKTPAERPDKWLTVRELQRPGKNTYRYLQVRKVIYRVGRYCVQKEHHANTTRSDARNGAKTRGKVLKINDLKNWPGTTGRQLVIRHCISMNTEKRYTNGKAKRKKGRVNCGTE